MVERAAPARPQAEQAEPQHQQSHADHDAERPEGDRHRRPVLARHGVETSHRRIERMFQDQRPQPGDFDRVFDLAGGLVRPPEQDQRRAVGMTVEMALHRHDFHRLVLQRVEAVLVAGKNLDRRHQGGHPHRHREHDAGTGEMLVAQQVIGADRAHHQRGGQIRRQHHVHQAIGKRRIEDHLEPVDGDELPFGVDGEAGRRLHPGIGRQDPERRDQRAHGDHQGGEKMQPVADPFQAEQHDPEKARLEKEGGQHLIGHQGADHGAGLVGKRRPVGAELVGHHDARHHAHAERDREDLQPVIEQVDEYLAPGPQPERFQHREVTGKPDREGRKYDVERHREGELRPRQHHGIPALEHRHHPSRLDCALWISCNPGRRYRERTNDRFPRAALVWRRASYWCAQLLALSSAATVRSICSLIPT